MTLSPSAKDINDTIALLVPRLVFDSDCPTTLLGSHSNCRKHPHFVAIPTAHFVSTLWALAL
jgi:hypothetical protein